MAFQRAQPLSRKNPRTRAEVGIRNHQDKRSLVEQGRAHGFLVYADGEPIGWWQFGPVEELPALARRLAQPAPTSSAGAERAWRVTCFVVDKRHHRRGVAGLALRATLEAIRARGGGIVETYPIARWTHGPTGVAEVVDVPGVEPLAPAHGSFGNVSTAGTVSMFAREGFAAVAVLDSDSPRVRSLGARGCHVLMRRAV